MDPAAASASLTTPNSVKAATEESIKRPFPKVANAQPIPDSASADEIIKLAIQVKGGAEKLAKFRTCQTKSEGKLFVSGKEIPYKLQSFCQFPKRYREEIQMEVDGKTVTRVLGVDGESIWRSVNGTRQKIDKSTIEAVRDTLFSIEVGDLTTLLGGKYALSRGENAVVRGRPTVGVKISSQGNPDVHLDFDKETGLCVQSKQRSLADSRLVREEFSDFRDFDGVLIPTRIRQFRDDTVEAEVEVTDSSSSSSFDLSLFRKP
ncbi:MAG: hypothetical protein AAB676_13885 [Verrucomicrobiota bacterium]